MRTGARPTSQAGGPSHSCGIVTAPDVLCAPPWARPCEGTETSETSSPEPRWHVPHNALLASPMSCSNVRAVALALCKSSHVLWPCAPPLTRPQGARSQQNTTVRVIGSRRVMCPQPREGQGQKRGASLAGPGRDHQGNLGSARVEILPPCHIRPPACGSV